MIELLSLLLLGWVVVWRDSYHSQWMLGHQAVMMGHICVVRYNSWSMTTDLPSRRWQLPNDKHFLVPATVGTSFLILLLVLLLLIHHLLGLIILHHFLHILLFLISWFHSVTRVLLRRKLLSRCIGAILERIECLKEFCVAAWLCHQCSALDLPVWSVPVNLNVDWILMSLTSSWVSQSVSCCSLQWSDKSILVGFADELILLLRPNLGLHVDFLRSFKVTRGYFLLPLTITWRFSVNLLFRVADLRAQLPWTFERAWNSDYVLLRRRKLRGSSRVETLLIISNINLHPFRYLTCLAAREGSWRVIDLLQGLCYFMCDRACLHDSDLVFIVNLPLLSVLCDRWCRWVNLSDTWVKRSCSSLISFWSYGSF